MTSVDSGVETGNDSNDSAQPEIQPNPTFKVTGIITTTDKQFTTTQKLESVEYDARPSLTKSLVFRQDFDVNAMMFRGQCDVTVPKSILIFNTDSGIPTVFNTTCDIPTNLEFKLPANFVATQRSITKAITVKPRRIKGLYSTSDRQVRKIRRQLDNNLVSVENSVYKSAWERRMRSAVVTNNIELLKSLLEKGVSPNNHDDLERTPLHLAACRGFTAVVKLLLDYGANPNEVDCLSNTPLHLAAVTCKIEIITLLLKAGADVLSSDRHGHNPLQLAQSKLRMLQNCQGSDMNLIKEEVHKIVGMLLAYLQKQKDVNEQIEELSSFCSRISLSNNTDQVQDDLKGLLASIDTLSLTS